jgi:hypothetical protein
MAQHQDTWPVSVRCEVLEVSRRGFDADRQGQATVEIDVAEVTVVAWVQAMATQPGHSDGSRRRAKPLQAEGYAGGTVQRAAFDAPGRRLREAPSTVSCHHRQSPW